MAQGGGLLPSLCASLVTQRAQYDLIKEYTFSYTRIPSMIQHTFLNEAIFALWDMCTLWALLFEDLTPCCKAHLLSSTVLQVLGKAALAHESMLSVTICPDSWTNAQFCTQLT